MFDFEKLEVYGKAKIFNKIIFAFLIASKDLDRSTKDQLRMASLSIPLNIAEGSSRFSKPDRRNFFVVARGSVFECVAILDILKDENSITIELEKDLLAKAEELSKMLFAMIKNLEAK